jgi:hypothetical protein
MNKGEIILKDTAFAAPPEKPHPGQEPPLLPTKLIK